jgi:hypothetical protein
MIRIAHKPENATNTLSVLFKCSETVSCAAMQRENLIHQPAEISAE